ncbi:hypothetical protein CDEST_15405 [Colletotrichum destructivum]|uniref:Uncharacterized protein n=1 Tax=Colletotrichum destructivum TaxID=34406 RepID=A0AAX4J4J3_9PEZI|nr:hypothetical protein CDEST_15405 [Colletotrichum destructivum]
MKLLPTVILAISVSGAYAVPRLASQHPRPRDPAGLEARGIKLVKRPNSPAPPSNGETCTEPPCR